MTEIVVLAEEQSGCIVAEALVAKLGLEAITRCVPHQGKGDLERSLERKIQNWKGPIQPRFIIMRDNDGRDCYEQKQKLLDLVPEFASARVKVRLVVQELESWYLGDIEAIIKSGLINEKIAAQHRGKRRCRDPDSVTHAKREFKQRIVDGGQLELARQISPFLSIGANRSRSFHSFVAALRWGGGVPVPA